MLDSFKKILFLGDGAWGTTLAILLAERGRRVWLWGAFPEYIEQMRKRRVNENFLPGIPLPETVELISDMGPAMAEASLLVFSTPVVHLRKVAERAREVYRADLPVMTIAKGIENETMLCASGVIRDCLGDSIAALDVGLLMGPSHAEEVARKLPATVVASARNADFARAIQQTFMGPWLRVYTSADPVGVELAAALKFKFVAEA